MIPIFLKLALMFFDKFVLKYRLQEGKTLLDTLLSDNHQKKRSGEEVTAHALISFRAIFRRLGY